MQVETLRDVLEWTTRFHRSLGDSLRQSAESNPNARADLLLDYLAKHEHRLGELVAMFEDRAETRALETWCYDYREQNPILHRTDCDAPFAELDAGEIMDMVADQHQQVIELYRYLHARADTDTTRELMAEVKELEERETMQMTQGANRLEDM
ncbi:ATPase [Microbulbifer sediminum]|uniref:ATPase n=1 Tax=Microbulbifer sediminum TaxID=2904250 RepID=UPI001F388461|nr:ATPase [Microbulbifer sediminum]